MLLYTPTVADRRRCRSDEYKFVIIIMIIHRLGHHLTMYVRLYYYFVRYWRLYVYI